MTLYTKFWLIAVFLFVLYFSDVNSAKRKKLKKDSSSYISVRTLKDTRILNATHTCYGGGWLPEATYVSCMCIKGIWAISTDYCDQDTTIYTGDGHCFQINMKIRKLFNLDADKAKPFVPSNYLVPALGQYFQTVKKVHQLAPLERFSYLLRVNPRRPMFQKHLEPLTNEFSLSQCTPAVRKEFQSGKNNYVFITQASSKNHFSLGTPGWCDPDTMAPYWTLNVGQSFRLSDQQITEGKVGKPESCVAPRVLPSKKRDDEIYYLSGRTNSSPQTQDIETIQYNEFDFRAKVRSGFDDYDGNSELKWPLENDPANQIKLLDVQTKRMGGYYKKWTFYNRPGPKVTQVKEIAYLQLARKLFIKTCKSPAVTVVAVNNFFRWFRWLWRESLDVYSYNQGSTHADAHTRIVDALTSCYNGASPFNVIYKKECGPPLPDSVISEGKTYTAEEVSLPSYLTYDISKMEPSLEFIYKIMIHAHHYCAEYFGGFPTDHSTLQVSFQSVFSPLLKIRWKNPGSTMRLLELLWPTVQIPRFFDAVDVCIGTSRAVSAYKDVMERPLEDDTQNEVEHKVRKKRSVPVPRNLWDKLGYCVEDPKEVKARYNVKEKCVEKEGD